MAITTITEASEQGFRALRIENGILGVTVLPDKGADIYRFEHLSSGLDVLWKTPWGLKTSTAHADSSATAWRDRYAGGWQVLMPSAGPSCVYGGVEIPHHGEACASSWEVVRATDGADAEVLLGLRLSRMPLLIERRLHLPAGEATLSLTETVTNTGAVPIDYMWAHHPAIGAPLLSGESILATGARTFVVDDMFSTEWSPVEPGSRHVWPSSGGAGGVDLGKLPGPDERRAILGYLTDFEEAWWSISNPTLGVEFRLEWSKEIMPYAYLWQECHASSSYPWWGRAYVIAIEPASSIPARGLTEAITASTHRRLAPNQSDEISISASLLTANKS